MKLKRAFKKIAKCAETERTQNGADFALVMLEVFADGSGSIATRVATKTLCSASEPYADFETYKEFKRALKQLFRENQL